MKARWGRRSLRLPEYDYSQSGAYFVTICVEQRLHKLGHVRDNEMHFSEAGKIVQHHISELSALYPFAEIGISTLMPNHVHLLFNIVESRGGVTPPLHERLTLGQIVGKLKYVTTKSINQFQSTPGIRFWQRNYYERVVRNETEYAAVYNYILDNPRNWEHDEYR